MRVYATMSEMKDYIKIGEAYFSRYIGNKTISYDKFLTQLDKIRKKFTKICKNTNRTETKRDRKILDKYIAYKTVYILILSTQCQNHAIDQGFVKFMANNYDPERTLSYFDPFGYKKYLEEKNKVMQDGAKIEDNQQKEIQSQSDKPYQSDNYIDLE